MRRFSSAKDDRSRRSKIGSKIGSIGKIRKRRQRPTLDQDQDQDHRSDANDNNSDKASKDSDTTNNNRQQLPSSSSFSSTFSGVSQVVLDVTGTADAVAGLIRSSAPPRPDSADQRSVITEPSAEPVTSLADDDDGGVEVVTLAVSCGDNEAQLRLNDLRGGSRRSCVLFDGSWVTPNGFQAISGRGNAKDWKRSIRHHGRPLKFLMERGLLSTTPPFCICHVCESQGRENRWGIAGAPAAAADVDLKPIKRTKISSTAKGDSLPIGRRRRKYATTIDLNPEETRTSRKTRKKTKQNETIDRDNGHNQYGRRRRPGRRAQDCGKTKTLASTTRRRRWNDKMATRAENFEQLLKGTEKIGRSKRGEVEGERAEPDEKAFELCDDDSRTIIDGGELFAAAAAADGGSGVVSAAFQEIVAGREENSKSFEISVAAKDGVALCAAGRPPPRKRGRKRKGVTTTTMMMMMNQPPIDATKRPDEKRAKIEDDSNEIAESFGTESRKADDEKVPKLNKSPEEDDTAVLNERSRLGKDEKETPESKEVDKLNENHQDRSQTMKLWHKEISDGTDDERITDTKPATVSYGSEEFRNPLKDQSVRREDKFSSFLIQSTLFTSHEKDFDSKQNENGRQFTTYRQPSGTSCTSSSSSSRGRRRRRRVGRGGGSRACVTSKMADSTTIFDARSHATMTSSSKPIDSGSDYVNRFSRSVDVTLDGVKTRKKKMDRIRLGSDVTETRSPHLSPWKLPEAGKRFDEFPVGNLPETIFGNNSLSPNDDDDDDIRFRAAMTSSSSSSLLPVCSLRHLRGLCSGLDLGRPPRPPSSSSVGLLRPHEPLTGAPQRRRPRGGAPRQRRNGVVSSTTFDLPMTSSYDPTTTMTSLYRQQISSSSSMMSSSSATAFQRRDLYRRSPGAFLFYAQGAPLERRLQPMDLYCGRVVAGGASSLAVGDRGVTPPPGSTDGDRFVYDDCGALDLTVPKVVRSA